MNRRLLFLCLASMLISNLHAQRSLSGKVYDKRTDSTLAGITVTNLASHTSLRSARDGSYSIPAHEGDQVVFTGTGFLPDTIKVDFSLLLTHYDPSLSVFVLSLKNVTVTSSYREDSINRRNEYRPVFDSLLGFNGGRGPTDGVGVSFSPLSYFTQKAKAQRRLRKRLLQEEKDSYIDHAFPAEWVATLTGLKDDSLRLFMYRYRPSYDFCRKTSREDMIVYISDHLKEFRKARSAS